MYLFIFEIYLILPSWNTRKEIIETYRKQFHEIFYRNRAQYSLIYLLVLKEKFGKIFLGGN